MVLLPVPFGPRRATRSPRFPDLPTVAEAGTAGIDALAWWGALAPARTPEPILRRMGEAVQQVLSEPDIRGRIEEQGADVVASGPERCRRFLNTEVAKWGQVIRDNNITADG